jgi:hypothetical protein
MSSSKSIWVHYTNITFRTATQTMRCCRGDTYDLLVPRSLSTISNPFFFKVEDFLANHPASIANVGNDIEFLDLSFEKKRIFKEIQKNEI